MSAEPTVPGQPKASLTGRWVALTAATVVFVAVCITFWQILGFNFVHRDDRINVFQNPYLLPPLTWGKVGFFWQSSYYDLYMPVTYSLWALCAYIGLAPHPIVIPGGDTAPFFPAVFHGASILLHAMNAVLVFLILRTLFPGSGSRC